MCSLDKCHKRLVVMVEGQRRDVMLGVPNLFKKDSWVIIVVNSEHECLLKLYRYNKIAAPDYGTYQQHKIVVIH
jgi:hypothetical protein